MTRSRYAESTLDSWFYQFVCTRGQNPPEPRLAIAEAVRADLVVLSPKEVLVRSIRWWVERKPRHVPREPQPWALVPRCLQWTVTNVIDEKTGWYFVHASIKAVVVDDGKVLLCRNPRDEWELPGGWPDRADRTLADTVVREVREECGIEVTAGDVVHGEVLRVGDDPVVIVALVATPNRPYSLANSAEHSETRFFPVTHLPSPLPPVYQEAIRRAETHDNRSRQARSVGASESG